MPSSNTAYVALRAEADEAMRRLDYLSGDQLTDGIEHARVLGRRADAFARRIIEAIQAGEDPATVTERDRVTLRLNPAELERVKRLNSIVTDKELAQRLGVHLNVLRRGQDQSPTIGLVALLVSAGADLSNILVSEADL